MKKPQRTDRKGLLAIAVFKYVKAVTLLLVGLALLKLLHRDLAQVIEHWAHRLHINPENRYLARLIERAGMMPEHRLLQVSIVTFFYSALLFTEGTGLFFEKRWAEYLTVVATSVFVPWEVYELFLHFTLIKLAVFIVNLLIIGYLVWIIRGSRHH